MALANLGEEQKQKILDISVNSGKQVVLSHQQETLRGGAQKVLGI